MRKHCGLIGAYCDKDSCTDCIHVTDDTTLDYELMEKAIQKECTFFGELCTRMSCTVCEHGHLILCKS